jgi:phage terminase large subunit-like protein
MKTIHALALTTLATALAAGTAFAQDPPPPAEPQTEQGQPPGMETHGHERGEKPSYDELNTRGDDRVTRADLAAHPRLLEKFDDIDAAGDGAISRAEYDAWKARKAADDMRPQD